MANGTKGRGKKAGKATTKSSKTKQAGMNNLVKKIKVQHFGGRATSGSSSAASRVRKSKKK